MARNTGVGCARVPQVVKLDGFKMLEWFRFGPEAGLRKLKVS